MAEAAVNNMKELDDEDVCSVCTDPTTRDPRLLDCGHHFCKRCLEKLVAEQAVTCPTCRYVTQVNNGIGDLLMFRTTNIFSKKIKQATDKHQAGQKTCGDCEEKKPATRTCMECWVNFCEKCAPNHGKAEKLFSHKTYPLSVHMYCREHNDKGVLFVCETCHKVCCPHCLTGAHHEHQLEKVKVAGEKARERLVKIREDIDQAKGDEKVSEHLNGLFEKAKKVKDTFKTSMDSIKKALTDLTALVDKVNEEVNTKMTATIKMLEMMTCDIGDYMTSKTSLRELLTYLIEDASNPEVVIREKELPKYDKTTYKQVIREPEVEIAELGDTLNDIKEQLDKCQQDLDISFTKHSVCGPQYDTTPLSNLQRSGTIQAGNKTYGLAVDSGRQRLVVRRQDAAAPISVYDFQGQRLQVLGQGVEGITHAIWQGIAIDTKRDLYVLPVNNGSLVTMDTDGNVKDKIKVIDSDHLNGVAYSEDFYITCGGRGQVHMVNPDKKQKVATFSPKTTFSEPFNVSSGLWSCVTGEPQLVFIISNCRSHCIKLVDSSGRHLHTYGKEEKVGHGEGELYSPWGVRTGPGGRIIVCDINNHRVVAFWREDDKDKWEVLLDKDKLTVNTQPRHVTCDPISRRLFVGYDDGTIYIYQ